MKKLVVLLLILLLAGCAGKVYVNDSIHPRISEAYFATVSIVDHTNRYLVGAGTVLESECGKPLKVITAAHVIRSLYKRNLTLDQIKLQNPTVYILYNSRYVAMAVQKISDKNDLAILVSIKNMERDGPYVKLASNIRIGSDIWAIGSPNRNHRVARKGVISGVIKHRGVMFYQIDAPLYNGNSGGGIFNNDNELVGVASFMRVSGGFVSYPIPGECYTVSLEEIKSFIK